MHLALEGRITAYSAASVWRSAIATVTAYPDRPVVVDASRLEYADDVGIESGEVLMYSGKRAMRNDNLGDNPRVAFNLHTDAGGGDYVSMEGMARLVPDEPPSSANPEYVAKYQSMIEGYGWDNAYFDREYPHAIRITPTRWRVG